MPVAISENPGADYTWDSTAFSWDSPTAAVKSWDSANLASWACQASDAVGFLESTGKAIALSRAEDLRILDAVRKGVRKVVLESLSFTELYIDNIAFTLRVFETIGVLENVGKAVRVSHSEAFGLTDAQRKAIGLNRSESVELVEAFSRSVAFTRQQQEAFRVIDAVSKGVAVSKAEALLVRDKLSKDIRVGKAENLAFAEAFGRTLAYKRRIAEGLRVADALSKAYRMSVAEALGLVDVYLRNSNAVVSDMLVSNQDITFEDFLRVVDAGRVPGYTDFRTFVQGDYEYSEAIFRVLLEATSGDRGSISELKVSVDVPDVFDRGLAMITDAQNGLYVEFARPFHIVPEMSMLLKGGTVLAFPRLTTLDEFGFTVKLFDKNEVAVTGSVSWAAHGY